MNKRILKILALAMSMVLTLGVLYTIAVEGLADPIPYNYESGDVDPNFDCGDCECSDFLYLLDNYFIDRSEYVSYVWFKSDGKVYMISYDSYRGSTQFNLYRGDLQIGLIYHRIAGSPTIIEVCTDAHYGSNNPVLPCATNESSPTHTHDFVTGTIYDATCDHDGLEGTYCKTCGYILNSSPISAFGYTLETYAQQKIEASKSGQKIVLEFGELNSFPKSFMEKIAARVAEGVTFEFRYNVNHKLQKITIPAYSTVDTNLDWYGPATMEQLYGAN